MKSLHNFHWHRLWHSCNVLKLFSLPPHPPYVKRSQRFVWLLNQYLGNAARQRPPTWGWAQTVLSPPANEKTKKNRLMNWLIVSCLTPFRQYCSHVTAEKNPKYQKFLFCNKYTYRVHVFIKLAIRCTRLQQGQTCILVDFLKWYFHHLRTCMNVYKCTENCIKQIGLH